MTYIIVVFGVPTYIPTGQATAADGTTRIIIIRARVSAIGSWFIIIIIRGHSPWPPQGLFYFYYYSFSSLPFLYIRASVIVYTVSGLYHKSSVHTSLISHFRYILYVRIHTHTYTYNARCTMNAVSGFPSLVSPTKWN